MAEVQLRGACRRLITLYLPRQGSAGSLAAGETSPPSTRVEFNGHLGYPHSGSTGTTGRAARERRVPRPSSTRRRTRPPPPKCRRRRASASWPQPGVGHIKPQTCIRTASRTTYITLAVRSTPCLTSHQANCRLCHPSFNGRRPPDAPLFPPQLIAALPSFQAIVLCGVRRWFPLSHVKSMADLSLPARLITGVEQLVWSTYMVAREFPFTILPLILIAFASLALLAVS